MNYIQTLQNILFQVTLIMHLYILKNVESDHFRKVNAEMMINFIPAKCCKHIKLLNTLCLCMYGTKFF